MHVFYIPPIYGTFIVHNVKYVIDESYIRMYVIKYVDNIPIMSGIVPINRTGPITQFIVTKRYVKTITEKIATYSPQAAILCYPDIVVVRITQ